MIVRAAVTVVAVLAPLLQERINNLKFMQGCWERSTRTGTVEEQWLRPRAGSMLGVSRTTRGDSTVAWEFMRIYERAGQLVFEAQPSGQQLAEFVASEVTDSSVTFANLQHDFPQRVSYRRGVADSLFARIEGERGGQTRAADFRYLRVSCT